MPPSDATTLRSLPDDEPTPRPEPRPPPGRAFPHEPLTAPADVGIDPRGLARVLDLFRLQQRSGLFPGGQIAVRREGRLVLDHAVGFARGFEAGEGEPLRCATPATSFPTFSAGKPLVAIAIAMLEERGRLDVDAPIAEVFPEFAARGKERITTHDVLTHRGGILMPEFSRRPEEWSDWNRVVDAICSVRPSHERGVLAYHPLEYGWVLAEVVRRVSGRRLDEFVRSEFLEPAGLTGLRFGVTPAELDSLARSYWLGGREVWLAQVNVASLFERALRMAEVLTAFVPGGGLVADAATLTALYDLMLRGGVARSGQRLLTERTVRVYTARHAYGWCRSNNAPLAVGRGFLVGASGPTIYGWWDTLECFGHPGLFCTVAFGDRRTGLSVAFVTNGNRGPMDMVRRFVGLAGLVRRCTAGSRLGGIRRR